MRCHWWDPGLVLFRRLGVFFRMRLLFDGSAGPDQEGLRNGILSQRGQEYLWLFRQLGTEA